MTAQLDGMLEHFADVDALDLSTVEPMTQPYRLVNVMRPDVPGEMFTQAQVLELAPESQDGFIRVPRTVEG